METRKLLSARQVADHLGMHIKSLYKMLRENRIPLNFVRLHGNRIAFRPTVVEAFLASRDVTRDGSGKAKKKLTKVERMMANARFLTDEEAQQFFEGLEQDPETGAYISDPDKDDGL